MKSTYSIEIDQEICIQCRLCAIECPSKTAGEGQIWSDQNSDQCDRCFHCYAICPQNAIRIDGFHGEKINGQENDICYDHLLHFLKKRRSIRRFKDKPVSGKVVKSLTDVAQYAPTGGNAQDLSITVINNQHIRKELEQSVMAYYKRIIRLLGAPLVRWLMRFSGDAKVKETAKDPEFYSRIRQIYARMQAGENNIFYDAPLIMLFHTERLLPTALEDCILAAYQVVLAAESLELGSCFVSLSQQAISSSSRIRKSIGIPPGDRIHAVLVLGFPAASYRRTVPRQEKNVLYR